VTLRDDALQREQREQAQREYVAPTQAGAAFVATGAADPWHVVLLCQVHSGASRFFNTRPNGRAMTSPTMASRDLAHHGILNAARVLPE
jgi:hypothetical protein